MPKLSSHRRCRVGNESRVRDGLPVGGKEWMQQGEHHEKNGTRGMGLENERSCDMGVHLRASASIAV